MRRRIAEPRARGRAARRRENRPRPGRPGSLDSSGLAAVTELLILSDGRVLAHNLTPAMADVLRAVNPYDVSLRRRAGCDHVHGGAS